MAYLGKGDPDRYRGAGDPCRSAVDLHVDNDGGLVRSDDGRHAGHDGSGNDAVTGRIRSLSSASNLRHWSSTSFGVSEFFATKAVSRACSRTLAAFDSARQAEPSAFVLDEPSCYDFRVLDPLWATRSPLASRGKALELTGDGIDRLDAPFRAAQDQRTLHRR